jgi:hypothetical protein
MLGERNVFAGCRRKALATTKPRSAKFGPARTLVVSDRWMSCMVGNAALHRPSCPDAGSFFGHCGGRQFDTNNQKFLVQKISTDDYIATSAIPKYRQHHRAMDRLRA